MKSNIVENNIFLLFILTSVISCSSIETLKINEINECLGVNRNIQITSQCISKFSEYTYRGSSSDLFTSWVTDACENTKSNDCSEPNLIENLKIEKDIIKTPCKVFFSKSGNFGGSYVRLYVFYNKDTKNIIGWVNRGASYIEYNFRKK